MNTVKFTNELPLAKAGERYEDGDGVIWTVASVKVGQIGKSGLNQFGTNCYNLTGKFVEAYTVDPSLRPNGTLGTLKVTWSGKIKNDKFVTEFKRL